MENENSQVNSSVIFFFPFSVTLIFPKSGDFKKKKKERKEIINYLKMLFEKKK